MLQRAGQLDQTFDGGNKKEGGQQKVETSLSGGLVRDDGTLLYPIVDEIPVMLVDEAIPLDQLD